MPFTCVLALRLHPLSSMRQCISRHRTNHDNYTECYSVAYYKYIYYKYIYYHTSFSISNPNESSSLSVYLRSGSGARQINRMETA